MNNPEKEKENIKREIEQGIFKRCSKSVLSALSWWKKHSSIFLQSSCLASPLLSIRVSSTTG
jgi:hypothetical protein